MIIHRDASVSNEAPVGINQGNESIISRISAQLGKEITVDEIREAQIFKPDILNSIENGKLEDDEIDILIPSLESRISGKNPIAGVSYDFGFGSDADFGMTSFHARVRAGPSELVCSLLQSNAVEKFEFDQD